MNKDQFWCYSQKEEIQTYPHENLKLFSWKHKFPIVYYPLVTNLEENKWLTNDTATTRGSSQTVVQSFKMPSTFFKQKAFKQARRYFLKYQHSIKLSKISKSLSQEKAYFIHLY